MSTFQYQKQILAPRQEALTGFRELVRRGAYDVLEFNLKAAYWKQSYHDRWQQQLLHGAPQPNHRWEDDEDEEEKS